MDGLGTRIAFIRNEILKISQEVFAQQLDVAGASTISNWEKGIREPEIKYLKKIAFIGNVSLNWLLSDKKISADIKVVSEDKVQYLSPDEVEKDKPKNEIELPLCAEVPASSKLREINFYEYPEYFGVKIDPKNHFAIKVHEEYGYSMSPAISPGDFIICNSNPKIIKDGDLVLVQYDNTMGAIKKYHRSKELKAVTLYSTNTAEPPITLHENKIKQMFKVSHIIKK